MINAFFGAKSPSLDLTCIAYIEFKEQGTPTTVFKLNIKLNMNV